MEEKWWIGNDDADPLSIREVEHEHQCLCDLVMVQVSEGQTLTAHDRCTQSVHNPEQAICDECEAQGHADLPQYRKEVSHG